MIPLSNTDRGIFMEEKLKELQKSYNSLEIQEKEKILKYISKSLKTREIKSSKIMKNKKLPETCCCPHCNCHNVKKNGNHIDTNGLKIQKYKCCECNKIFRDSTKTVVEKSQKIEKWEDFIKYLLQGLSLRKMSEEIGEISYITLFNWKKKFLKHLEKTNIEEIIKNK